ncbi:hypothetical protein [Aurantibacillus circumpalustris]|uniref:hypothetical protein n=1 Tax=Aurantibacillus circumpalustris TaxID=3036359 RepID=UPI00295AB067|nr:hypothetical protein [Aurantibacillus circumpalustris]
MKLLNSILLYLLFLFLGLPLFYFVYKFGDPEPLAHDFFQYYWLYKDFDVSRVIAPHNMRLVGAFFAHLFYQANFFYDTATVFDKYAAWGFLKQVYFNAVFFNYLSVAATCLVLFSILKKHFKDFLFSFTGSLLYLLGFGTLFYELMPLTDAFSILLFAIALKAYLDKKPYIIIPLLLLVFQREYILIAVGTYALIDYLYHKDFYFLKIFIACSLFFLVHVTLRKTVFYTPHLDYQASGNYFSSNLFHINYSLTSYLKQLAMTLNLLFVYLGIVLYKKLKGLSFDGFSLIKISILFLQINVICHLAGHGNNCGRYFYMLTPLIVFMLIREIFPLVQRGKSL